MNKLFKFYMTALLVVFFSFAANITFAEDATPSGTVTIETTAVAIGVGFNWGDGVLYFQGKEYPFKVKGVSIVDIGIAKVSAVGDVYHLKTVDDFSGTFSAIATRMPMYPLSLMVTEPRPHASVVPAKSTQPNSRVRRMLVVGAILVVECGL
jgi:hypothetical protein